MVITWYNLDKSTQFPNPSEVPQRNWWGNWWWNLNSIFAGQRTPRMVDLQEWLQDGFAHEFHFFQTPRSEPWSKFLSCNVANNKKTTWVDFHDISGTHPDFFFPIHPPEGPHQLMLSRITPLAFIRPARSCRSAKVVWEELQQLQLGMGQDVTGYKNTAWCERFIKFILFKVGKNSPKCWIIR